MATHHALQDTHNAGTTHAREVINRSRDTSFREATRVQESFTSKLEKRVLVWLATCMPAWVHSDHLTVLGFVAMFLTGASYVLTRWNKAGLLLATLFLVVNWFGDSLDGTLARVRNQQRPRYGFYVDHVIDAFGGVFLTGGLALSGLMDWRLAMALLIAFQLLSIESYLAAYTTGSFRLSHGKFGPTEIRLVLAAGNMALWFNPAATALGLGYRLFDVGASIAIVMMAAMLVTAAARNTARLYREETVPRRNSPAT
jgi:phosphatidylglycerophosphate synthase